MNEELTVFVHEQFGEVRVTLVDGEPWALAKDVAVALGYSEPRKAIQDHCKGVRETLTPSKGGMQVTKIIPESDILRLVIQAPLLGTIVFWDWLIQDVFPTLRDVSEDVPPVYAVQDPRFLDC